MRLILLACLIVVVRPRLAAAAEPELFRDPRAPLEQRVDDLLHRLTVEEKAHLCYGNVTTDRDDRFKTGGVARLGIPQLMFRDGPVGVRTFDETAATALPGTLGLACTWDVALAHDYGRLLAAELAALHGQVLFGPGLNLMRDPRGGRNFEYLGEDPLLAGVLGAAYVEGAQELGVAACAKHLVANDYEARRHFTSSNLDERTLRELHLLPFELAVREGHVWSIMTGNNLLNGTHAAANRPLLQELLKGRLGFDGVALTDWRGAYETGPTALAGTDMTTGLCAYVFGEDRLLKAVQAGAIPLTLLDDKVRRVLRLYARTGLLDPAPLARGALDTPEHRAFARHLAAESMVLLKNDRQILPLDLAKIKTIFVTGPGADVVRFGRGSGEVHSAFHITPRQGLRAAIGDRAKLVDAAPGADVVLYCTASPNHGESNDLKDLELPGGQADAIAKLTAVNPNVVVVLQTGAPVDLEAFVDKVPVVLVAWYAGESTGDAIADVLLGNAAPGGRLACTFGKRLEDYPCGALGLWPPREVISRSNWDAGMTAADRKPVYGLAADYKEGVFIGYRWFDDKKIEPRFPFGFGLGYTSFTIGGVKVDSSQPALVVSCEVKNTGARPGEEVVEIYVAPPASSVPRPPRELKGFAKVTLAPGESRTVQIPLRPSALAYFDATVHRWRAPAGTYAIEVGASSRDLRGHATVTLAHDVLIDWY